MAALQRYEMNLETVAQAMVKSGFFADTRDQAQAVVKILAGAELGFGPIASMTGIHVISGKIAIGANLMAAAVKRSGRYNYRVAEMSATVCRILFFEGKEQIGVSEFTLEDGKRAGVKNLDKFARNMLFARAMSNGVRWYCPDVFDGGTPYTPEELGATVNEDGEVIDVTPSPQVTLPPPSAIPAPIQRSKRGRALEARINELIATLPQEERGDWVTLVAETGDADLENLGHTLSAEIKARAAAVAEVAE